MTATIAPTLRPYGLAPVQPRKKRRLWGWLIAFTLVGGLAVLGFLPLITS